MISAYEASATPDVQATIRICGENCLPDLKPPAILALADVYRRQGRIDAADALLRALLNDPDRDMRLEARFRLAQGLVARRRFGDAIVQLDMILTERPDAGPVRLELARALEAIGNRQRSLREYARVQAGALPADLAREIDRAVSTLRSTKKFGGNLELGLAPDSNVNAATDAEVILINGIPFQLDESARRKSGLGLEASGQLFWRLPLSAGTRLVIDGAGQGNIYRRKGYSEGSLQLSVGPEFSNRMRPAIFGVRRWYRGTGYSWSYGANWQWLRPISRGAVLDLGVRIERMAVERSSDLDGMSYAASAALERAIRPTLFTRISIGASRYRANAPAFATTSGSVDLLVAKDFGRLSVYARGGYSRLKADGLLFGQKRLDNRFDLGGGVSLRRISIFGASPVIRISRSFNRSTSVLYDTSRTRLELALSRPL